MTFVRMVARCRAATLLILGVPATSAHAQRRQPQEFTQQVVLVSNFWIAGRETPSKVREDLKFGREVGDRVRKRLGDLVNKRETKVISGADLREALTGAGFPENDAFGLRELRQHGRVFRTDEMVIGTASRAGRDQIRIEASLVLYRDLRLRQPVDPVVDRVDEAAAVMARRISDARIQLRYQRRCENALRDGQGQRALQHAREGVALYPRGALVRTCLLWALRATGASAETILTEAQQVLAIDSGAAHALETAAFALDSLRRRDLAAAMWLRLQRTDTADLDLAERVVWALAEGGNSRHAEPLIVRLSDAHPENLRLLRQKWRVANDNRNWPLAVSAGERLLAEDSAAPADPAFFLRLASAHRLDGRMFRAMELASRGVAAFPSDARLYALYTQFVKEEADSVLPRGLALHPNSGALLALQARELRSKGQLPEALEASRKAVDLDSTIAQGRLLVAQAEMELGRPDSALATLARALASGEDRNTVAQFALSKGNALLRAANGTDARGDYLLAMRFLVMADTLKPTPQTKFVVGAAALKVAQRALTDAPRAPAKEESCALSKLGLETIPIARGSLSAGVDVSAEAAKELLAYLDEIGPFADRQVTAYCGEPGSAAPAKGSSPEM